MVCKDWWGQEQAWLSGPPACEVAKILLGANFNDLFREPDKTGLCEHVACARML